MSGLARREKEPQLDVERACAFLAKCTDLDAIRKLRDQAQAVARYVRAHGAAEESAVHALALARRAERRLGEVVAAMPKAKGAPGPGRGKAGTAAGPAFTNTPSLAEQGISKNDSSRWQAVASLPEKIFEGEIRSCIESKKEPRLSSFLRLAREQRLGASEPKAKDFHPLVAMGELRDRLLAIVRPLLTSWPERERPLIARVLRDIADEIERGVA